MRQAFVGEDDRSSSHFARDRDGNELVSLDVLGGTVSLIVDGAVHDGDVFDHYKHIQGEILMECGKVLRFQLWADGAAVESITDAPPPRKRRR
jgi:hypothetical protein